MTDIHIFPGFLSFPSFCLSLSLSPPIFQPPFLSFFLLSLMIFPPIQTMLCFCKMNPLKWSKCMGMFSFNRYCHITSQISLRQFTLLSAMNENIYSFTSLPELKLSFVFIFVNLMGKT